MKLVWSPDRASNAYIETVQSVSQQALICKLYRETGVAEMVSAMAAGWNAQLIVETWSQGGVISSSVGLSIASRHTGGRHVCILPDERSRTEYSSSMVKTGVSSPEIMVGEPEEVMESLDGIDFMVVDSRRKDFPRVLRLARLSNKGAVLLCKNVNSVSNKVGNSSFKWRSVVGEGDSRRVVRAAFLPVGKGLDMAHVSAVTKSGSAIGKRWIKHVDQESGDVHYIRT